MPVTLLYCHEVLLGYFCHLKVHQVMLFNHVTEPQTPTLVQIVETLLLIILARLLVVKLIDRDELLSVFLQFSDPGLHASAVTVTEIVPNHTELSLLDNLLLMLLIRTVKYDYFENGLGGSYALV